jgi:hypothetical protein
LGGRQLLQPPGPVVAQGLDSRGAQLVLAREVVVDRALGDVQPGRHLLHGDRLVAALAEQLRGDAEDLLHAPAALALHPGLLLLDGHVKNLP